jgi:hypothetical protein
VSGRRHSRTSSVYCNEGQPPQAAGVESIVARFVQILNLSRVCVCLVLASDGHDCLARAAVLSNNGCDHCGTVCGGTRTVSESHDLLNI